MAKACSLRILLDMSMGYSFAFPSCETRIIPLNMPHANQRHGQHLLEAASIWMLSSALRTMSYGTTAK